MVTRGGAHSPRRRPLQRRRSLGHRGVFRGVFVPVFPGSSVCAVSGSFFLCVRGSFRGDPSNPHCLMPRCRREIRRGASFLPRLGPPFFAGGGTFCRKRFACAGDLVRTPRDARERVRNLRPSLRQIMHVLSIWPPRPPWRRACGAHRRLGDGERVFRRTSPRGSYGRVSASARAERRFRIVRVVSRQGSRSRSGRDETASPSRPPPTRSGGWRTPSPSLLGRPTCPRRSPQRPRA